jgi:hypothetical protein
MPLHTHSFFNRVLLHTPLFVSVRARHAQSPLRLFSVQDVGIKYMQGQRETHACSVSAYPPNLMQVAAEHPGNQTLSLEPTRACPDSQHP